MIRVARVRTYALYAFYWSLATLAVLYLPIQVAKRHIDSQFERIREEKYGPRPTLETTTKPVKVFPKGHRSRFEVITGVYYGAVDVASDIENDIYEKKVARDRKMATPLMATDGNLMNETFFDEMADDQAAAVEDALGLSKYSYCTIQNTTSDRRHITSPDSSSTRDRDMLFRLPYKFQQTLMFEAQHKLDRQKNESFVLFTLINAAYMSFTQNWLCNTWQMANIHENLVVAAFNQSTCNDLTASWNITCLHIYEESDQHLLTQFDSTKLVWGQQAYINFLTLRAVILDYLISNDIPILLFETDAVWLRNPIEYFTEFAPEADLVTPVKGFEEKHLTLAFDPMLIRPTEPSKDFFSLMATHLIDDASLFDQDVLDSLCKSQHAGINCDTFPWDDVADGLWYKLPAAEQNATRPYVINNNFYSGIDAKITRQALNGQWFLTLKGDCDNARVQRLLNKYANSRTNS